MQRMRKNTGTPEFKDDESKSLEIKFIDEGMLKVEKQRMAMSNGFQKNRKQTKRQRVIKIVMNHLGQLFCDPDAR